MNHLTMDTMAYLAEQENTLWEHFIKYLKKTQIFFIMATFALGGNPYAHSMMPNR